MAWTNPNTRRNGRDHGQDTHPIVNNMRAFVERHAPPHLLDRMRDVCDVTEERVASMCKAILASDGNEFSESELREMGYRQLKQLAALAGWRTTH